MADAAYDGASTYEGITAHGDDIEVVIPPRSTAVPSGATGAPMQRDLHVAMATEHGRLDVASSSTCPVFVAHDLSASFLF